MHSKIIMYFSSKIFAGVRPLRWNPVPRPRSYGRRSRLFHQSENQTIQSHVSWADMKNDHRTGILVQSKNSQLKMALGGDPPGLQKRTKRAWN
jgi:hypothetical protein